MYVKSLFIKHNKFYINIYIISFEKKCIKIAFSVGQGGGGGGGGGLEWCDSLRL